MFRMDYDEFVGLLSTLGIVGALMLSLQVGFMGGIEMESLEVGNYREMLIMAPEVREFVLQKLQQDGFNFTVQLGSDVVRVDELLSQTHTVVADRLPTPSLAHDMNTVFHLTKEHISMSQVSAFASHNRITVLSTRYLSECGSIAIMIYTLTVVVSVVTYISLALSDAKEQLNEGNPKVMEKFSAYALPVLLGAFFIIIPGLGFTFAGCNLFVRHRLR